MSRLRDSGVEFTSTRDAAKFGRVAVLQGGADAELYQPRPPDVTVRQVVGGTPGVPAALLDELTGNPFVANPVPDPESRGPQVALAGLLRGLGPRFPRRSGARDQHHRLVRRRGRSHGAQYGERRDESRCNSPLTHEGHVTLTRDSHL